MNDAEDHELSCASLCKMIEEECPCIFSKYISILPKLFPRVYYMHLSS